MRVRIYEFRAWISSQNYFKTFQEGRYSTKLALVLKLLANPSPHVVRLPPTGLIPIVTPITFLSSQFCQNKVIPNPSHPYIPNSTHKLHPDLFQIIWYLFKGSLKSSSFLFFFIFFSIGSSSILSFSSQFRLKKKIKN